MYKIIYLQFTDEIYPYSQKESHVAIRMQESAPNHKQSTVPHKMKMIPTTRNHGYRTDSLKTI